jgi:hypothetical protein
MGESRTLVEVPELPGAMADGATPAQAVANAQVIIEEWLEVAHAEGRSIPALHPGAAVPGAECPRSVRRITSVRARQLVEETCHR